MLPAGLAVSTIEAMAPGLLVPVLVAVCSTVLAQQPASPPAAGRGYQRTVGDGTRPSRSSRRAISRWRTVKDWFAVQIEQVAEVEAAGR